MSINRMLRDPAVPFEAIRRLAFQGPVSALMGVRVNYVNGGQKRTVWLGRRVAKMVKRWGPTVAEAVRRRAMQALQARRQRNGRHQ